MTDRYLEQLNLGIQSIVEISSALSCARETAIRNLSKMRKEGWVERFVSDDEEVYYKLSSKGFGELSRRVKQKWRRKQT